MQNIKDKQDIDPAAKILIFDIEATLADTMPIHYEAMQEICRKHGFKCTRFVINLSLIHI